MYSEEQIRDFILDTDYFKIAKPLFGLHFWPFTTWKIEYDVDIDFVEEEDNEISFMCTMSFHEGETPKYYQPSNVSIPKEELQKYFK